ncbi:hypothetical protein ACZ90_51760 [Streptomyces albus subsp. albus]|nr:hypothetical protein ACZ90_51760 [Streptomyces albus subsp. albus]
MFLITLTYTAPLAVIDELKDEHYSNPDGVFARGMVRLAGRLEPRTGGLMVVEGDRAEVEAALASDPFVARGAATAEIIEFQPTWPAPRPAATG